MGHKKKKIDAASLFILAPLSFVSKNPFPKKKKSFKPNKIDFPFSLEKCLIQEKEVSEGGKMDLLTGTFFWDLFWLLGVQNVTVRSNGMCQCVCVSLAQSSYMIKLT